MIVFKDNKDTKYGINSDAITMVLNDVLDIDVDKVVETLQSQGVGAKKTLNNLHFKINTIFILLSCFLYRRISCIL